MAVQRLTQEDLVVAEVNENANARLTAHNLLVADINAATNARVTAENLLTADINANANVRLTEIVFLGATPRPVGGFKEMITPLTGHE